MRTRSRLLALACLGWGLVVMAARPCEAAIRKTYVASLGTLPDAQGFTLRDTGGSPPYTIQGDAMHQGLTSDRGEQYWYACDVPLDFDMGAVMEADLNIIYSSYSTSSGYQLTGWHMMITDALGRIFQLYIASDKMSLWNQLTFDPEYKAFDSTGDFHRYRLVIADGVGSLFIDGAADPFLTQPVGPAWYPYPNKTLFGDSTGYGQNESLLRSFSYVNVPEPAGLSLLAAGALVLLKRKRRP